MTECPHNSPDNSGGISPNNTAQSRNHNTSTTRKQRIRGCGVPATVWFAPHPETPNPETPLAPAYPDPPRDWVLAEIIRQFATVGENYRVCHLAHLGCPGDSSSTVHRPSPWPTDPVAAANALFEMDALHVVVPAASEGDCDRERRWHGTAPGQSFLARLQHHLGEADSRLAEDGILAILLPRPLPGAYFADETGAVIQAMRDEGLSYLQHIAVVDAFIDHDGITPALSQADLDAFHAARAAGLPVHARAHSDLLIFREPGKAELHD
ncbi:MAG TPA: hypothetical protein VL551_33995 [Actinospica sp.]|jgi:hypothetical protein|nr:hypothetical protein [Actinospica sp.]